MSLPDDNVFEMYKEGVYSARNCPLPPGRPNATLAAINHAVLVVGFNMDAALDKPYWIVSSLQEGKAADAACGSCTACLPCVPAQPAWKHN